LIVGGFNLELPLAFCGFGRTLGLLFRGLRSLPIPSTTLFTKGNNISCRFSCVRNALFDRFGNLLGRRRVTVPATLPLSRRSKLISILLYEY